MKRVCGYRCKGLWWFRVYGYGIHYKNTRYHRPLFSERNGLRKKLKLGRYWFGALKPDRLWKETINIIGSEKRDGEYKVTDIDYDTFETRLTVMKVKE